MTFDSLNENTGMLEDIDEVRQVGLNGWAVLEELLTSPLLVIYMPMGVRIDYAVVAASATALLKPTSTAEYARHLGRMLGISVEEVELYIRGQGFSETLPMTHPDAITPTVPIGTDVPSQWVRDSYVMQEVDRHLREEEGRRSGTPLQPSIEDFLREVSKKEGEG